MIDGVGVPAWVIHNRVTSGEDLSSIADDFDIPVNKVQRAVEYFEQRPAA